MSEETRQPMTIEALVKWQQPYEAALSPDGESVVFSLGEADFERSEIRTQVYCASLPRDGEAPSHRQITYGMHDATQPRWSPDGAFVSFVTFRPQPHENEDDDQREDGLEKQQVFLLPTEGGEGRRLTEFREGIEAYVWWPDGSGVAVSAPAPRNEAERSWRRRRGENNDDGVVVYGDIPSWDVWFQPLDGKPRRILDGIKGLDDFDISPDGRFIAYSTNHSGRVEDQDRFEVILREIETGEQRRVTSGRGGSEGGPRFTADGRYLLLSVWADPRRSMSRQDVLAIDLGDGASVPRLLLEEIDRDVEEFAVMPDGRVAVLVAEGMESRLWFIDPANGESEPVASIGGVMREICVAAKSGSVAFLHEDRKSLPDIAILGTGDELLFLTAFREQLESRRLARREHLRWSNEGFDHEGLLLTPATGKGGEPWPLLTLIHGGPHWRNLDNVTVGDAEAFAALGWAVFLPGYRGSSGAGQEYSLASYKDLGGGDARDILAGLEVLEDDPRIDTSRSAVAGASYGGYMTAWLLATTKKFKAGIALAGVYDLAQDYLTSRWFTWESQYLGGRPWEDEEIYRERSPLTYVSEIEAPLLILHGREDDNTPAFNARALHRALRDLDRTTELVIYPREGHGVFEPAHRLDAFRRCSAWLASHVLDRPGIHVTGRKLRRSEGALLPLGASIRRDYANRLPRRERSFLEVSFVIESRDVGVEVIDFVPCGGEAEVLLIDEHGDRHRPVGIPAETEGQALLFEGRGKVEAHQGEDGTPPVLPVTVVFEIPRDASEFEVQVCSFDSYRIAVTHDDEEEEENA